GFMLLRRDLLLGLQITDSSGTKRSGIDVWERLKHEFPRVVRAMLIHLKTLPLAQQRMVSLDFDKEERSLARYRKYLGKSFGDALERYEARLEDVADDT